MREKNDQSIQVVGIGNVGLRVLQSFSGGAQAMALHTDVRALDQISLPESVQKKLLGKALLHGFGTGGDPTLGEAAWQADKDAFEKQCVGTQFLILILGLGGGTGSSIGPLLAKWAVSHGISVLACGFMPFAFEGTRRHEIATRALKDLESVCHCVVAWPNDFLLNSKQATVTPALENAHKALLNGIEGIIQVARGENVLLGDRRAFLSFLEGARHEECLLGFGEGAGEHYESAALDHLQRCPFFVIRNDWKLERVMMIVRSGADFSKEKALMCVQKLTERFAIGDQTIVCWVQDKEKVQSLRIDVLAVAKEYSRVCGRACLYEHIQFERLTNVNAILSWQESVLRGIDLDIPAYLRLRKEP